MTETAKRGRPKTKTPRRANGEGSVMWDGNKQRWRAQVRIGQHPDGRPIYKQRFTLERDDAEQYRLDMLRQYRGAEIVGATPTLAVLAFDWLRLVNTRRAVSTRTNVESDVRRHIIDSKLGTLPVDRLTFVHVEQWLADMAAKGYRRPTITTYRKHLGQICRWAVKRRQMAANPVELAEMPSAITASTPRRTFTIAEAERFLAACRARTNRGVRSS